MLFLCRILKSEIVGRPVDAFRLVFSLQLLSNAAFSLFFFCFIPLNKFRDDIDLIIYYLYNNSYNNTHKKTENDNTQTNKEAQTTL